METDGHTLAHQLIEPANDDDAEERVKKQLSLGQEAMKRIRFWHKTPLICWAVVSTSIGAFIWTSMFKDMLVLDALPRFPIEVYDDFGLHTSAGAILDDTAYFLYLSGLIAWIITPMPDEPLLQRAIAAFLGSLFVIFFFIMAGFSATFACILASGECEKKRGAPDGYCWGMLAFAVWWVGVFIVLIVWCVVCSFEHPAGNAANHRRLWKLVLIVVFGDVPPLVFRIFLEAAYGRTRTSIVYVVALLPYAAISLLYTKHDTLREQFMCRMHRFIDSRSQKVSAAGLACLISGGEVSTVLKESKRRFRYVHLSDFKKEDIVVSPIMKSIENVNLYSLSKVARLGEIDAFVSHSWHDDPDVKWATLSKWCDEFEAKHKRPARLWFDKSCIDQADIEPNLRCLPVFLSGCDRLLIIFGETYLSRLWCVVELFVFVHLGFPVDRIELVSGMRKSESGDSGESARDFATEIDERLATFNAKDCNCFVQEDLDHILKIIQVAFGGIEGFNIAVRNMIGDIKLELTAQHCPVHL